MFMTACLIEEVTLRIYAKSTDSFQANSIKQPCKYASHCYITRLSKRLLFASCVRNAETETIVNRLQNEGDLLTHSILSESYR